MALLLGQTPTYQSNQKYLSRTILAIVAATALKSDSCPRGELLSVLQIEAPYAITVIDMPKSAHGVRDEVKVFGADDRSLKLLGELLSNDTSRKIIRCLIKKQMYTNELATKLDIPISLVMHHLKKLEELNLVDVEERQITKKTKKHKFFRMSGKIFVLPNDTNADMRETGSLGRILQEKVRYTIIGAAALFAFVLTRGQYSSTAFIPQEPLVVPFYLESTFVPLLIVIVGLVIERVVQHKKKKKWGD